MIHAINLCLHECVCFIIIHGARFALVKNKSSLGGLSAGGIVVEFTCYKGTHVDS